MVKNPYAEDLGPQDPLKALAETPRKIEKLTAGWTKSKWEKSYAPGKWSARRILVHLAQAELALTTRVRFAAGQDGYVAQPFDQDAWVTLDDHADAGTAIAAFAALHRFNLPMLKGMTP